MILDLDTIKTACHGAELKPLWQSAKKNKLRMWCLDHCEPSKPKHVDPKGEVSSELKVWIEAGSVIARCDSCGDIPDFVERIGLTPDKEPLSECLSEPSTASQSDVLPSGDDSPTPEVKPAEIVAPTASPPVKNSYPRYERSPGGLSFDDLVNELERQGYKPVKRGEHGYTARCPAHDDQHPSLDIDPGKDRIPLTICRSAGCSFESILDALGLKGVGYEKPIKTPYHVRKGVKVHKPAKLEGDKLVVPCFNVEGKKLGTQTIHPEKFEFNGKMLDKINSKGLSTKQSFFPFGDIESADCLLFATGYSTTASIYESTGSPSIMALSDETIPDIVRLLRSKYAGKEFVICADFDARDKFIKVAAECNALLCYPTIEGNLKADFNDLMLKSGKEEVCRVIGDARKPEPRYDVMKSEPVTAAAQPLQHKSNAASKIMTASDLWSKEFKPLKMIVTPILPEGVTLLVSAPKIGKTRLAGQLAIASASGGYALNHPDTITNKTSVLFMALESGDRRAQKDLKQMIENPPEGLFIVTEWPRLNDGGAAELEQWLDQHLDCKLVIIDTLAKIRDRDHGGNGFMYTADYEAGAAIKSIADKRGISILLLHHANKMNDDGKDLMDTVSGSTGVTGSVDHILFLKRNRLEPDGLMTLISRDFEDRQFAMTFKDGLWTLIGDPNEAADDGWRGDGNSNARHEILAALRKEPMKPAELATRIGKNPNTTRRLLQNLAEAGQVTKRFDGKYSTL